MTFSLDTSTFIRYNVCMETQEIGRQSGRTTRMLIEAIECIFKPQRTITTIFIVTSTSDQRQYIWRMFTKIFCGEYSDRIPLHTKWEYQLATINDVEVHFVTAQPDAYPSDYIWRRGRREQDYVEFWDHACYDR